MPTLIPKCQLIPKISYTTSSKQERTISVDCFTTFPLNRRDKLWMIGVAGTTTTAHSLPLPQHFTLTKMDNRSNFLSKQVASMPKIAKLMQFKSKFHQTPWHSSWDNPAKSTLEVFSRPPLTVSCEVSN